MTLRSIAPVCCLLVASPVMSQSLPADYGFEFVTITDVGNVSYTGPDVSGRVTNRGSVGYDYRIASLETRTSQFLEFMNVLGTLAPDTAQFAIPTSWGAGGSVQPDGTIRFTQLSDASGDWPVAGINWRVAAIYCNWLHNDKAATIDALNNGAYDTSTFMTDPNNSPNLLDQASRHPDARYWIPSLDEWLKAAHYDPDKDGPGQGGWWQFPNGTDEPLVPGLPGEPGAETSYQLDDSSLNELMIPVGSYPDTQSPWGLLDVSGGATEWTETYLEDKFQLSRHWMGSLAGPNPFIDLGVNLDVIGQVGSEVPFLPGGTIGLRIASAIPSPGGVVLLGMLCVAGGGRRRR